MKKILIAFDGRHYSEAALQFAKQLNDKKPVLLTAAFLPQVDYASLWSYSGGSGSGSSFLPLLEDADAEIVQQNIARFESFCKKNKIAYLVHKDYFNFALPELKKESRFADLLLISSEEFYEQAGTDSLNEYLKETLHGAECPVVILPGNLEFPKANIFLYDGSKSSVYAIRQFAYILPELTNNPTIVFHTGENEFPDEENIKELVTRHFPRTSWTRLEAEAKKHLGTWLSEHKGSIVISGSFGRSDFSMLFKKSFTSEIISDYKFPVFIAHF